MFRIPLIVVGLVLSVSGPAYAQDWITKDWIQYDSRQDLFSAVFPTGPQVRLGYVTPNHGDTARGHGIERDWD